MNYIEVEIVKENWKLPNVMKGVISSVKAISPGADSHKVSDYAVSTTGGMHYVWMFFYVLDTLLIYKNSGRFFKAGSFEPKKFVQIFGFNVKKIFLTKIIKLEKSLFFLYFFGILTLLYSNWPENELTVAIKCFIYDKIT